MKYDSNTELSKRLLTHPSPSPQKIRTHCTDLPAPKSSVLAQSTTKSKSKDENWGFFSQCAEYLFAY